VKERIRENERDYGQEAIEILLQVVENSRNDMVVIVAGYADRMNRFFESNPGFRSRITHHIDFPDYSDDELMAIAEQMLAQQNYRFDAPAKAAFAEYIPLRRTQEHFANARSMRKALDRMRLRLANRIFSANTPVTREDLVTVRESDVRSSRVFNGGINVEKAVAQASS
jgi:hypothetical protein